MRPGFDSRTPQPFYNSLISFYCHFFYIPIKKYFMLSSGNPDVLTLEEGTESIALDYFSHNVLLGMKSGKISLQLLNDQGGIISTSTIHGHESPVTSIDWAHPGIGDLFVRFAVVFYNVFILTSFSCEEKGIVIVWCKDTQTELYQQIFSKDMESTCFHFSLILFVSYNNIIST